MNSKNLYVYIIVLSFLGSGCLGQKAVIQETFPPTTLPPQTTAAPTCPPTVSPSTVPPVTVTSVPTTIPPTTPAPKPTGITILIGPSKVPLTLSAQNYGAYVPEFNFDSQEYGLYGLFVRDLYDTDDTDMAFFQNWIYFYYMKYSSTSYAITSQQKWEKAKNGGLQKIKGLGEKEVQNIINYVDAHLNNDIVVEFVKGKDYSAIYVGTDGFKETKNVLDEHAILTRLDIYRGSSPRIGNPDLAKVTNLDPEYAAFFYVLPNNALDQFFDFITNF